MHTPINIQIIAPSDIITDDQLRSDFIRRLILHNPDSRASKGLPPRLLVQFWNDASHVPADVRACLDSWTPLEQPGFRRLLFDDATAFQFIDDHFSERHVLAFEACGHPAMRADYFRLCFMLQVGGLYVDADDRYLGSRSTRRLAAVGSGCRRSATTSPPARCSPPTRRQRAAAAPTTFST